MARLKKLQTKEQLDAELAGRKRYRSTKTCMRGHIGSQRFIANDGCCACHDERRGKPYAGERVVDKHTPDREAWLAHRAATRAATVARKKKPFDPFSVNADLINQTMRNSYGG